MNRKLFRFFTLFVTVLLALAITVPALADPPVFERGSWEEDVPLLICGEDVEIWSQYFANWQDRFEYDENGDLVSVFFHASDKWRLYNKGDPELFIDGTIATTYHANRINGEWMTGSDINFHAPGYPQLSHFSGYWGWDEDGNFSFEHGRMTPYDIELVCELLTP